MRSAPTLALALALLATPAAAETPVVGAKAPEPEAPPRSYGNLRVGASSANENGRPELCLELSPLERLSVEACGTGAGILHRDPLPEVAHFRGSWVLGSLKTADVTLQPQVSLGFAELQIGEDAPGFRFRDVGSAGVETAGPEASVGVRALLPLAAGFELVGKLEVGTAYLPYAPELTRVMPAVAPWAGLSVGAGF